MSASQRYIYYYKHTYTHTSNAAVVSNVYLVVPNRCWHFKINHRARPERRSERVCVSLRTWTSPANWNWTTTRARATYTLPAIYIHTNIHFMHTYILHFYHNQLSKPSHDWYKWVTDTWLPYYVVFVLWLRHCVVVVSNQLISVAAAPHFLGRHPEFQSLTL